MNIRWLFVSVLLFISSLCPHVKGLPLSTNNHVKEALLPETGSLSYRQEWITRNCSRNPLYIFDKSKIGFLPISVGVGVSVGTSAQFNFSITLNGFDARKLSVTDAFFRTTLNETDLTNYQQLFDAYSGGLHVPFLQYMGMDLSKDISREDQDIARARYPSYESNSCGVRRIFRVWSNRKVTISGNRRITGNSLIPTTYFVFIKVARVEFDDGREVNVVSTKPQDFVVASASGNVLDTGIDEIQVSY